MFEGISHPDVWTYCCLDSMVMRRLGLILCWCCPHRDPCFLFSVIYLLFIFFPSLSPLSLCPSFINYPDSPLPLSLRLDHYLLSPSLYPLFLSLFITQPFPCKHAAVSPTVCLPHPLSFIPCFSLPVFPFPSFPLKCPCCNPLPPQHHPFSTILSFLRLRLFPPFLSTPVSSLLSLTVSFALRENLCN